MALHSRGHTRSRSRGAQNTPKPTQHHSRQLDLPQDVIRYIKIKTTNVAKAIDSQGVCLGFEVTRDGTPFCFIQSSDVHGAEDIVDQNVEMLARQSFALPNVKFFETLPPTTVIAKLRESRVFVGFHFDYINGYIDICSDTDQNVHKAFDVIRNLQGSPNWAGQQHARAMLSGSPGQQHVGTRHPRPAGQHNIRGGLPRHTQPQHSRMSSRQNSWSSDDFQDKLELKTEKLRYLSTTSELRDMKGGEVLINVNTFAGYVEVSGGKQEVFSAIEHLHELTSHYVTKSFPKHEVFVRCLQSFRHAEVIAALRAAKVQAGWDVGEAELLICSDNEANIEKATKAVEGFISEWVHPAEDPLSPQQIEATEVQPEWLDLVNRLKKINVELQVDYELSKVLFATSSDRSTVSIVNQLDKFFSSRTTQTCQVDLDNVEMEQLFLLNKNVIEDSCASSGETLSITVENRVCYVASISEKGLNHARKQVTSMKKGIASSSVKVEKSGLVTWLLSDLGKSRLEEISTLCRVSYKLENYSPVSSSAATKDMLHIAQANIAEMKADGVLVGTGALCKAMEKSCGSKLQEGFQLSENCKTRQRCHVQLVDLATWRNGSSLRQLRKIIEQTLRNFSKQNLKVVCLPAVGTGSLGYPKKEVAETMVTAVVQFLEANPHTSLQKINFVSYYDDIMAVEFIKAIDQFQTLSPSALSTQPKVVTVKFTALTQEMATEAKERLNIALEDLLVQDKWTNSPHRSSISQLSSTQMADILVKARQRNVDVKISDDDIEIEGLKADVPVIRDEINAQLVSLAAAGNQLAIPANWKLDKSKQDKLLVKVDSTEREYNEVKTLFLQSCSQYGVRDIEILRVQNVHLHRMYEAWKEKVKKEVGGEREVERQLWHGTDASSVMSICKNEFNRSFAGKHGTAYGQGSYFSTTSGYSIGYSKSLGDKYIILAKVATGRYIRGTSSMDRKSLPENCHSTVNNESNPSIFVVYHDASAYPQYVVKCRCGL